MQTLLMAAESYLTGNWIKFPLELIAAVFLFSYWHKKQHGFLPKFAGSAVLVLLISFLFGRYAAGGAAVLQYFLIFILVIFSVSVLVECDLTDAVLSVLSAYATQHIANGLYVILRYYLPYIAGQAAADFFIGSTITGIILYLLTYIGIYYTVYKILVPKIRENGFYLKERSSFYIFMVLLLTSMIVLNFARVYLVDYSIGIAPQMIYSLYSIISCVLSLIIISGYNEQSELSKSLEITKQMLALQKKQYEMSQENIELINIKCHDLKHQISALRNNMNDPESEEALKEIEKQTQIYSSVVRTDNEALNIILTEKSLICESNRIDLTCMVTSEDISWIASSDLYSIFGNLLDNAIEAVMKFEDPDKRIIGLTVASRANALIIHTENYVSEPVVLKDDGLPASTKGDDDYHGFGTRSLKLLAEKYKGTMSIVADDDIFNVDIILPIQR